MVTCAYLWNEHCDIIIISYILTILLYLVLSLLYAILNFTSAYSRAYDPEVKSVTEMSHSAEQQSVQQSGSEIRSLRQKATKYYKKNGVPDKIELILNEMFIHDPEDVYGYLVNNVHFSCLKMYLV